MERYDLALQAHRKGLALRKTTSIETAVSPPADLIASTSAVAHCLLKLGRCEEALARYEQCIQLQRIDERLEYSSEAGITLSNVGECYERLGRFDEAQSHYEKSLEQLDKSLGPGHAESIASLERLIECLKHVGRYEEAIGRLDCYFAQTSESGRLGNTPGQLLLKCLRSQCIASAGRHKEALHDYVGLLGELLASEDVSMWEMVVHSVTAARSMMQLGRLDDALRLTGDVLKLLPEMHGVLQMEGAIPASHRTVKQADGDDDANAKLMLIFRCIAILIRCPSKERDSIDLMRACTESLVGMGRHHDASVLSAKWQHECTRTSVVPAASAEAAPSASRVGFGYRAPAGCVPTSDMAVPEDVSVSGSRDSFGGDSESSDWSADFGPEVGTAGGSAVSPRRWMVLRHELR